MVRDSRRQWSQDGFNLVYRQTGEWRLFAFGLSSLLGDLAVWSHRGIANAPTVQATRIIILHRSKLVPTPSASLAAPAEHDLAYDETQPLRWATRIATSASVRTEQATVVAAILSMMIGARRSVGAPSAACLASAIDAARQPRRPLFSSAVVHRRRSTRVKGGISNPAALSSSLISRSARAQPLLPFFQAARATRPVGSPKSSGLQRARRRPFSTILSKPLSKHLRQALKL